MPPELRIGLFEKPGSSFPAWVRFSSDTIPTMGDFQTTLGIGIKLFGVDGPKLIDDPEDTTFDLILQNFEVFFLDTAADMCAFTKAGVIDKNYDKYLDAHPETRALLDAMAKPVGSVLATPYWSGLPFRFGSDTYAKYKLEPLLFVEQPSSRPDDPTYLAADLRDRVKQASARFRFLIQLRKDADQMPLDRATVPWSEELSPPIHVADLVLHMQDVTARGQPQYGENLALNIWRVTKDHEPVGSLADARRAVYAASAEQRRNVNRIPIGEPDEPRPILTPPPAVDSIIVRAAIHPAIGIARIGHSKTEYFIGPELVEAPVDPTSVDPFRDSTGAIKRQAAASESMATMQPVGWCAS
ncbi:LodA/GoxA family CTQ-dependent oxidase (plasmid) [Sinorhizobium meliloti]|nr:LodA/GoxA family CTQ-dependent oxidase [Sinorhizobium meliloti]